MKYLLKFSALAVLGLFAASCGKKQSSDTTGWNLNDPKWGGFEKRDYEGQATGPNLVLIEGGTFTMGLTDQDVSFEWNNVPRRVTVSSFYMDETEVTNHQYKEYLYWLRKRYGDSYPEVLRNALPDTLVWREELAYNEPFVETYFRHPAYDEYPVVGVNWLQASEYCKWRTDRVNEMVLIKRGVLNMDLEGKDENTFNTEAYLVGQYQGNVRKNLPDLGAEGGKGERQVQFEDGILLPAYRLPTEAEWEYAALGLQGNMASSQDERITDRRLYPWNGNTTRYQKRNKYQGKMMANFKRSNGDYMGMSGNLNDHASGPGPVRAFHPNDFGLYNMAGNVSEWTMDVFRPMTSMTLRDVDKQDLNPFRGNKFMQLQMEDGVPAEKDSLGRLRYVEVDTAVNRDNYKRGNVYNYLDGDAESQAVYETGKSTLVSDKARVIKGGSWADRAFWLSPGARRFKDEDRSDNTIGFRCAMTRTGSPGGNNDLGGNRFSVKRKKVKRRYN